MEEKEIRDKEIKDIKILSSKTKRFKGNLHSHTTNSDGHLKPEQSIQLFKEHGYSFLCLSEHDLYTDYREQFDSEDFIILPGLEASAYLFDEDKKSRLKVHHIHGILGTKEEQNKATEPLYTHMQKVEPDIYYGSWDGAAVAQKLCDKMRSHGCITTYNHPVWSRVEQQEFENTEGLTALEIFNYNTVNESGTGFDSVCWDLMLRKGKKIFAVATDDNHNEGLFDDACGGYIVVQAEELSHDAIITAIENGSYYSSAGPEINEWGIRDGKAYVTCSDVYRINFVCGNHVNDGKTFMGTAFDDIREASYELKGHETYIRVECIDRYGRTAWSNPIFLR